MSTRHWRRPLHRVLTIVCVLLTVLMSMSARAQQVSLGHRVLGTLGLDAGRQPQPGLVAGDRLLSYSATSLRDRNGDLVPVEGLELNVLANGVGVAATFGVPAGATTLTLAIAAPLARIRVNTARPEARLDNFGVGDLFVQPLKLGWRFPHFDIVTSYAFYLPTGRFSLGDPEGVSSGQVTNELALGGTVYVDRERTWYVTALASYALNKTKIGIDITRGDTVQLQGGAGVTLFGVVDAGVATYALWQVRDDRGADLPAALQGAREQVYGVGPEVAVTLAPLRSRIFARWLVDIGARSRPEGNVVVIGAAFAAWRPRGG